jgi:hypothetical protein
MSCYCDSCIFEDAKTRLYQIHLTVSDDQSEDFLKVCKDNSIKTVVIDNIVNTHTMTAHTVEGGFDVVIAKLWDIRDTLKDFNIIRAKVETNNPSSMTMYEESHLSFPTYDDILGKCVKCFDNVFMSRTATKTLLTVRTKNSNHKKYLDTVLAFIGIQPTKIISEYCVFDDNIELDEEWIAQQKI